MSKKQPRRLTLTVEEAGALLGVGRSTAYELVRSGEIPCIRLRRRIVVPIARLAERLDLPVNAILLAAGESTATSQRRARVSEQALCSR